eukprot:360517-Chlamydomonas_euryale.AAC.2
MKEHALLPAWSRSLLPAPPPASINAMTTHMGARQALWTRHLTITGSTFDGNTARFRLAGAVYASDLLESLTIDGTSFSNGRCTSTTQDGVGGAVRAACGRGRDGEGEAEHVCGVCGESFWTHRRGVHTGWRAWHVGLNRDSHEGEGLSQTLNPENPSAR